MNKSIIRLSLVAALALVSVGCAAPKYLLSNNYLGKDKIARFQLQPAGSVNDDLTFNAYVEVCNLDKSTGQGTSCNSTLLLENVFYWQVEDRPTKLRTLSFFGMWRTSP